MSAAPDTPPDSAWADATLVAALLAVDPACGGVVLRGGAGAARDAWLSLLRSLRGPGLPWRRLPGHIADERLLGGLDLVATLAAGRPVVQRGLLSEADGGTVVAPMAERLSAGVAARVSSALDRGEVLVERDGLAERHAASFVFVAMDESVEGDDAPPAALLERLAYAVGLGGITARDTREAAELLIGLELEVLEARARLPQVDLPTHLLQTLCAAAEALGVGSLRADIFAARTARAHAALAGRTEVDADDVAAAVRLVLGPRATRLPEFSDAEEEAEPAPPEPPSADPTEPPPPPPPEDSAEPESAEPTGPLDDMLLQAALATLPHDLLARLQASNGPRSATRSSGKSGAAGASGARGRPVGVRRGDPRTGQRLNLVETLRAAAPWQGLRRQTDTARRVHVRSDDLRVTVRRPKRETTTLFVVDASGSSALNRLAEAKGAVELLLADCYVRRDSVALMAFRGRTAQLLLPATRSLVRAKRSLAGLPGGGGTPLAAALHACAEFVLSVQRRGQTPLVVLLTDGRANVALDGTGGRPRAEAEALVAAQQLRLTGCATLLVDSSPQAHPLAARLAHEMRATYLPLPHAGAQALSGVVRSRMAAAVR